jgi:hypothetical protein
VEPTPPYSIDLGNTAHAKLTLTAAHRGLPTHVMRQEQSEMPYLALEKKGARLQPAERARTMRGAKFVRGESLPTIVEQLGLRLEARQDHAERTPAGD